MGANELMPKAKRGHSAGIFGNSKMGATVVDAIDTMAIMGLNEEVKQATKWVTDVLTFDVPASVSVFEVTIRFVGGLLSAYAITKEPVFKDKAYDLGKRLLPAFETKTGIPMAQINLQTGSKKNWGWSSGKCSILSEFGTMQLEFEYLSLVTGDMRFQEVIRHVTELVLAKQPAAGLYPNYLHPDTGQWGSNHVSLGALGDSFYEYLLKMWIYRGGRNHIGQKVDTYGRTAFDGAMRPVKKQLVFKSKSGWTYVAESKNGSPMHKMGHLACFVGGMFGMAEKGAPDDLKGEYIKLGTEITETCYQSYKQSASGLGPEGMTFSGSTELTSSRSNERYYILRPEVVESYFYMWRLTKDQKWRDHAWEAVQAIEKNCRCGENGYCGVKDVSRNPVQQDDVQQSFFLAETLKYLYLIFCDDDVISLDEWVFNTEAHTLPIQNYKVAE
jgi:mannosyl-oligosaccharide alpha-1,2-mannosidase